MEFTPRANDRDNCFAAANGGAGVVLRRQVRWFRWARWLAPILRSWSRHEPTSALGQGRRANARHRRCELDRAAPSRTHVKLTLTFNEPDGFDADEYPVRATVKVTARFNGIAEARQLPLSVLIKPDIYKPDPKLLEGGLLRSASDPT
jgi:hypothetical protein